MPVLTNQYWMNAPKMQFTVDGGSPYSMVHNPTAYGNLGTSDAQIEIPASVGLSSLLGGVEYSPQNIGLQWDEMDTAEYEYLSSIQFLPCTMIDMEDYGFYGYLRLVSYEYIVGAATKVGKCTAIFMAIAPAPGNSSTINQLNGPSGASVSTSISAGGSIGGTSDITVQYALSYWSQWGETLAYSFGVTVPGHTPAHQDFITINWTPPSTLYYRRARLYIATTNGSPISPGDTAFLAGDILWAQTSTWTDFYANVNGQTYNKVVVPSVNKAYKGFWGGGRWNNDT